jgi:hypothetical protein
LGVLSDGIVAGWLPAPWALYGLPFGARVWAGGSVVLPAVGLYEPIWYDVKMLAKDLSAHLVYGLATATAYGAAHEPSPLIAARQGRGCRWRTVRATTCSGCGAVRQRRACRVRRAGATQAITR